MPRLAVIVASTRPGRLGPAVGTWFAETARAHGAFDVDVADLAEIDLPIFDEPNHPRLHDYVHEHTKAWSARVKAADAFAIVSPEYNFTAPPSLVNAIDYLHTEWAFKPVGLVTYGGISAGLRSAQTIRLLASTMQMFVVGPAVAVPFFTRHVHEGVFEPLEQVAGSAKGMLDELARVAPVLAALRA